VVDRQLCPGRSSPISISPLHRTAEPGAYNNDVAEQLADAVRRSVAGAHRRSDGTTHQTSCRRYERSHGGCSDRISRRENAQAGTIAHPTTRDSKPSAITFHERTNDRAHKTAIDSGARHDGSCNSCAHHKYAVRSAIGHAFCCANGSARHTGACDESSHDGRAFRRAVQSSVRSSLGSPVGRADNIARYESPDYESPHHGRAITTSV
jgi:hypothetical protein